MTLIILEKDQSISTFGTPKPCHPFCTLFLYNNRGYDLVGLIIEKIGGEYLDQILLEKLFKPLKTQRVSTSWDSDDDNYAKSYAVLHDLTPVEMSRPKLGNGTLMEAARGVKSTIEDLTLLYTACLRAIISQFSYKSDSNLDCAFQNCRTLVSNHARFPGVSLRDQGYGGG